MAAKKQKKAEVKQISSFRRKITNIDFEFKSPVFKGVLIFAVVSMFAAFIIYHVAVYVGFGDSVKTQTAVNRTITKSISAEGIVIREEHIISGTSAKGTLVPRVQNGSKVREKDVVAEIFASAQSAEAFLAVNAIDDEIAYYEDIAAINSGNLLPNKDSYNQNIADSLFDLLDCITENRLNELNENVMDLSLTVTKKQIALGKPVNVDGILASLYEQKERFSAMVTSGSTVEADKAGYYVKNADGYENITDYSTVLGITPEEVSALISSSPEDVSDNKGKLITRFVWYIACVVDKEEADQLAVNQNISIFITGLSGDSLKMTLVSKNEGENEKVALVFKSDLMNSDLAALRLENIKICLEEYSGYAVDKKALRTVNGEAGVYVKLGNLVRFRKIEVAYSDDNIILAATKNENGYLRLYDEIITEGTDLYDGKIID